MDDSCSEMREFRVEIPSREIARCPLVSYRRFEYAVKMLAYPDIRWWRVPDRDVTVATGKTHPLIVAGLMALAQGHDLDVISEKIESLV